MQNIWLVGIVLTALVGSGAVMGMGAMNDDYDMHHMMHGMHDDSDEHQECEYEDEDCDEEHEECDMDEHMEDHGCWK